MKTSVASLSGLQKILYDLNADGVKVHTESLVAALSAALANSGRTNLQPIGTITKKQQTQLDTLRDKMEANRVATTTRVGILTDTTRTGDAAIALAIRQSQPIINVSITGSTVRVTSGATLSRTGTKLKALEALA